MQKQFISFTKNMWIAESIWESKISVVVIKEWPFWIGLISLFRKTMKNCDNAEAIYFISWKYVDYRKHFRKHTFCRSDEIIVMLNRIE